MSFVTYLQDDLSYPPDFYKNANSVLNSQPGKTQTQLEAVESAVLDLLAVRPASGGKRMASSSAEQSASKRLSQGTNSATVSEYPGGPDAGWTQEQLRAVLGMVERRKLTPWDPLGVDEMTARVGFKNRQECLSLFNRMLIDDNVYQVVQQRVVMPLEEECLSDDSSGSSESEPVSADLDSWTFEQYQVLLNEMDRRKVNSWDPIGFDEITLRVGGGRTREECLAMYNRIAMDESLNRQLRICILPPKVAQLELPDDSSLDRYLATGELYSGRAPELFDNSISLFTN